MANELRFATYPPQDMDHEVASKIPQNVVLATDFAKQMGDLPSREDKKYIPTFDGTPDESHVGDRMRSAERISRSNDLSDSQTIT